MLLTGGITKVGPFWEVNESSPPGFVRVYRVYGGYVRYTDPYEQRVLQADKLYVFPSATPYAMVTSPQDDLHCTFIHVDIYPVLVDRLLELDCGGQSTLAHIIRAIESAYREENGDVLPPLAAAFETWCMAAGLWRAPDPLVADVHAYIERHYAEPLSVGQLSAHYGYNEQYFIRLFKAASGITPYQYLLNFRLKKAVLYLDEGNIAAAAVRSGFRDTKTFSRAFYKRYGVSPGRYKQEALP